MWYYLKVYGLALESDSSYCVKMKSPTFHGFSFCSFFQYHPHTAKSFLFNTNETNDISQKSRLQWEI